MTEAIAGTKPADTRIKAGVVAGGMARGLQVLDPPGHESRELMLPAFYIFTFKLCGPGDAAPTPDPEGRL